MVEDSKSDESSNSESINNNIKAPHTALLGSLGNDHYGDMYNDLVSQENILPFFETISEGNTGICCVYCFQKDRGHITDLGVSTLISEDYVNKNWVLNIFSYSLTNYQDVIKTAEFIYTELFILKHKKEIVYKLAEEGCKDNKIFGFNFPSFYFIETYIEEIKNLIEYADIIFSNAAEAQFLGEYLGIEVFILVNNVNIQDSENIALVCENICKYKKINKKKKRVVIITCGPNPAYVCEYDFVKDQISFSGVFPADFIHEEKVVDTNGAGDGFAGGFLSRYIKGKSINHAMAAGHWAAAVVIQARGCQFPKICDYIN